MILVTTHEIAGKRAVRTLGLVRGNTIRARHLGIEEELSVFISSLDEITR
jgi:uncharacterized protein YbjQ (UPF0145 family)|tara:strand:+ start:4064 stop:4213 length:150 start_codon:yes stop_codon:yes gene_type:complete